MGLHVIVAVYSNSDGVELRAFDSEEKAIAWKNKIGDAWWEAEFRKTPKPDENEIGRAYFAKMAEKGSSEFFETQRCEVG